MGDTCIGQPVAAFTSSTENSGQISVITRPFSVTSSTHISVMILSTHFTPVNGRLQSDRILCLPPFAWCSIVITTLESDIKRNVPLLNNLFKKRRTCESVSLSQERRRDPLHRPYPLRACRESCSLPSLPVQKLTQGLRKRPRCERDVIGM